MVAMSRGSSQPKRVWVLYLMVACSLAWCASVFYAANARPRRIIAQPCITGHSNNREKDMFELARRQSFGFFYDIPDGHWRRLRKLFLEHVNHRYPDKPLTFNPEATAGEARPEIYKFKGDFPGWSSYPAWYQNNYEPNFAGCQFETRVGVPMNGDGPKWVCDPYRIKRLANERKKTDPDHPGCVIYSIGSNGDFTFELGMQKEVGEGTCEYHIFDPGEFSHMQPPELKRAHYHRWGLEKQKQRTETVRPMPEKNFGLHDIVKLLGHESLDVIDIFKIDCEKCEWETYQDWLSDDIPLLHQILVEVHEAPKDKALDFFDSLERAGYLRFHKEANIQWASSCIEYAFIRVDKSFVEGKRLGR